MFSAHTGQTGAYLLQTMFDVLAKYVWGSDHGLHGSELGRFGQCGTVGRHDIQRLDRHRLED